MRFLIDRVLTPLWRAIAAFGWMWAAPGLPQSGAEPSHPPQQERASAGE